MDVKVKSSYNFFTKAS